MDEGTGMGALWLCFELLAYRKGGISGDCGKIGDYFAANIPEDGLIPVDFCQPAEPLWYDDTAAAVAACGFLELSGMEAVPEDKRIFYREAALKLLKALDEKHCDWTEKSDCFLIHCSGSYHGEQHNHTLVYADSFFLEAILKLKGAPFLLW